ncbi:hypothetical protein FRC20_004505 [Serendipita sp. 405]|nr:hypothetical protein FRC20_004505 [Serendipita sp. 405]
MIIDFNLLKGLNRTIYDALFIGLSLEKYDVRERASNFLKEDPDISRRRTILDQDLERFTNARLEFENIPDVRLSEFSDDDNKDDDNDDANTDTDADSLPSRKDFVPRTIASRSPSPISPKVRTIQGTTRQYVKQL